MNGEIASLAAGGADALGHIDPYQLLGALRDIASPRPLAQEAPALLMEWTRIAAGISELQLPAKDARFSDPTWRDNPWYKRLAQAYLGWAAGGNAHALREKQTPGGPVHSPRFDQKSAIRKKVKKCRQRLARGEPSATVGIWPPAWGRPRHSWRLGGRWHHKDHRR